MPLSGGYLWPRSFTELGNDAVYFCGPIALHEVWANLLFNHAEGFKDEVAELLFTHAVELGGDVLYVVCSSGQASDVLGHFP